MIIHRKFFRELHTSLSELIWGIRTEKRTIGKVQLPLDKGELGAPSSEAYCIAANLKWAMRRFQKGDDSERQKDVAGLASDSIHEAAVGQGKTTPAHLQLLITTRHCWQTCMK